MVRWHKPLLPAALLLAAVGVVTATEPEPLTPTRLVHLDAPASAEPGTNAVGVTEGEAPASL